MNFWTDDRPLVLGSASPRRREILRALGLSPFIHAAHADESVHTGEAPEVYLVRVVLNKLAAVRQTLPESVRTKARAILVADTSVVLEGKILGKPADKDDALAMLRALSGRDHEVLTRFAVALPDRDILGARSRAALTVHEETVVTRVTFRPIEDDEARAYAESGEGMDKAGGYAIQGAASAFAKKIDGSYSNVVGLPACEVSVALRNFASVHSP